jgi:ABC-type branched-subunit amino acid transport system ATPase component/ABC-type branched-subunit amino acid transport system permease subunit
MFRALAGVIAPSVAFLLLAVAGLAFDTYVQYVVCLCLISALVGTALVLLMGYTRVVMLGTSAMMAIGAYGTALMMLIAGLPYLAALVAAGVLGAIAGIVLGVPAGRFRGHHLAMVTLVFQALVIIAIREWPLTGGAEGIRVPLPTVLGFSLTDDSFSLLLTGAVGALVLALAVVFISGWYGKIIQAMTATEIGASAFGVNVSAYRIGAFAIASSVLALAGGLLAPRIRILDPESFGILQSVHSLAYPIVGGMTSVWGGFVGGVLLRALPEALRVVADYADLVFAAIAVVVVLRMPNGLVPLLSRLRPRRKEVLAPAPIEEARDFERLLVGLSNACPAPDPTQYALRGEGISVRFGNLQAVDDVNLLVQPCTIHGLIGPNGAGKTTLFNVISGFMRPNQGSLHAFGESISGQRARARIRHGITRTFQHVAIAPQLSCLDNVVLGLGENGIGRALVQSFDDAAHGPMRRRREERADAALAAVGLYHRRNDEAVRLSLGDQRRLELARAIVCRPRLLLLDEPVSGVEADEEKRVAALLQRLCSELSITMVLIEHNIRFIADCCSVVSVMVDGRILAEGTPRNVLDRQDVQEAYFGKIRKAS